MALSSEPQWPWKNLETPVARGAFILIEGLDRAGKTTQVKTLCERLYSLGHNVKEMRFPDRSSPIGQMISSYLQSSIDMDDHAIHLLFAANRWEKAKWIDKTLSAGYTIVCDRYYYSGMIYSAAKENPSLSLEWARTPEIGLPKPDVVIFLDLDPAEAEKRGGYGDEKYEKKEMQQRVRKLFLEEAKRARAGMKVVDAGASMKVVGDRIYEAIAETLTSVASGSLGKSVRKLEA